VVGGELSKVCLLLTSTRRKVQNIFWAKTFVIIFKFFSTKAMLGLVHECAVERMMEGDGCGSGRFHHYIPLSSGIGHALGGKFRV